MRIISVGSGRNGRSSLPSVGGVGGRSIVVRIVKRMRGSSIGIGVWLRIDERLRWHLEKTEFFDGGLEREEMEEVKEKRWKR